MTCRYCSTALLKAPHHPTWWLCPKCEPYMFVKPAKAKTFYENVLGHEMDTRGAPTMVPHK